MADVPPLPSDSDIVAVPFSWKEEVVCALDTLHDAEHAIFALGGSEDRRALRFVVHAAREAATRAAERLGDYLRELEEHA